MRSQSLFLRLIDQGFSEDSVRDPSGYLYRAAVNEARQLYRARERRNLNHTDDDVAFLKDPQSEPRAGENCMREPLLDAMAKLEPEYAEVLVLCCGHGYSDAEIAASLGKTRGIAGGANREW